MMSEEDVKELMPREGEDSQAWAMRVAISGKVNRCTHQNDEGELDCKIEPSVHLVMKEGYAGLCKEHFQELSKSYGVEEPK